MSCEAALVSAAVPRSAERQRPLADWAQTAAGRAAKSRLSLFAATVPPFFVAVGVPGQGGWRRTRGPSGGRHAGEGSPPPVLTPLRYSEPSRAFLSKPSAGGT